MTEMNHFNSFLRLPLVRLFLQKTKVVLRARGADFQVGGLTRTRKREPTRGVRGHGHPGKFEILFF